MSYFTNLQNNKYSYNDVQTTPGVNTEQFLTATEEGLVKLFDQLNIPGFQIVTRDMNINIKKVKTRFETDKAANSTIEDLLENEKHEKEGVATEGLLWLLRGLDFTAEALRRSIKDEEEELNVSFQKAYEETLKAWHRLGVPTLVSLAIKGCPYRKDFYEKIGATNDEAKAEMELWVSALERIVQQLATALKSVEKNPKKPFDLRKKK